MTTTLPGWYDDGRGALRWWDGAAWTEHTQTLPAAQPSPPFAGQPGASFGGPAGEPPGRSKLWIVWVVLGVVVVGLVVAAALVIPALVSFFAQSGDVSGRDDDERAAIAAVQLHDEAWNEADCALFEESTTASLRDAEDFVDCADFEEAAEYFVETSSEYVLTVTDVRRDGAVIVVTTSETFLALVDADGEWLDEPEQTTYEYVYDVVEDDGVWRVDAWG